MKHAEGRFPLSCSQGKAAKARAESDMNVTSSTNLSPVKDLTGAGVAKTAPPPLKLVAIGDSLTAGMQDANLCEERQLHSYPNLIAKQAGLPFKQPLMNNQGIPPKLFLSPGTSLT